MVYSRCKIVYNIKLIKAVIRHKSFSKIYSNKDWVLRAEQFISIFDMHLIFMRSIKDEAETKLDHNMKIQELKESGYLKDHRYPVFVLRDSRNSNLSIKFNGDLYEAILNNRNEQLLMYKDFLPRNNVLQVLQRFPVIFTINPRMYRAIMKIINVQ